MNAALLKRVDQLIAASDHENISNDIPKAVSLACKGFTDLRPTPAGPDGEIDDGQTGPAYTDMIESLLVQISQQVEGSSDKESKTVAELKKHREQLKTALNNETKEYNELLEERSRHIVSDDIHTGFDSTLINKAAKEQHVANSEGKGKAKENQTSIEVINTPGSQVNPSSTGSSSGTSGDPDIDAAASPKALEFASLPSDNLPRLYAFLDENPQIIKESEKDALMMVAFEQQLSGDPKEMAKMKNTVHNALLLQYCSTLGGPQGTRLFFSRISKKDHPALEAFNKDVDFTYNHIKQRCEIISQQKDDETEQEEGVEQIQLHAVDPNTEIVVTVPEEDSEGRAVYEQLSDPLRKAIETKKLDEINKVLGEMTVADAEKAVEALNLSGVLSVEEKIYDVNEWQAEKERILKEEAYDEMEKEVFGTGSPSQPTTTSATDRGSAEDTQPFGDTNDEVD
ncbi:Cdc37p [Sugiyamaella lignohabitans]|uniref:Hsp90 chaperone protein kinase-targeting subunit n=1 Tax=Sugiyamaella lignohabitans TaxID=796027 RepID=A0A167FI12_9ASCO|nr:Cdc37p [Sugiyamaella lignohabitans]ANB15324.1 Cdc37p [Sugiyamaella lignohabitans]